MQFNQLELKIPPPLLFIFSVVAIYFLPQGENYPLPQWLGLIFIGLGMLFDFAAIYFFRKAKTTVSPYSPERSTALVTTGIYQYSRNPMYLGLVFMLVGFIIFANRYFGSLIILSFIFYLTRFQIMPEERVLKEKFGQAFEDYRQKVRRWI